uniref:Uncharacterized protein n=1 Tax=Rhizophora mucronata TaxID=61149 RepID=A0A2P2PZV7_RHIMU
MFLLRCLLGSQLLRLIGSRRRGFWLGALAILVSLKI